MNYAAGGSLGRRMPRMQRSRLRCRSRAVLSSLFIFAMGNMATTVNCESSTQTSKLALSQNGHKPISPSPAFVFCQPASAIGIVTNEFNALAPLLLYTNRPSASFFTTRPNHQWHNSPTTTLPLRSLSTRQ